MLRTCSIRLVSCRPPFTLTNLGASASSRISSAATALPSHAHAHARSPVLGCALGRAFGRASMSTSTSPGQVQVDVRPNPQGITPPAFYLPQGQGQGEAKARAHPPHWNSDQPTKSGFSAFASLHFLLLCLTFFSNTSLRLLFSADTNLQPRPGPPPPLTGS